MIQVDFSSEQIEFAYKEKTHLSTRLTIKNGGDTIVYYKVAAPPCSLSSPDPNSTCSSRTGGLSSQDSL